MKTVKLLHCADIHLDMPFTTLGDSEGRAAVRRDELRQAFKNIISLAEKEKADLLLICGDLYEHEYVRKSTINFLSGEFSRIPHIKAILLPGNHDPYLPGSYYKTFQWPDNVHILADEADSVELEELGIRISGSRGPVLHGKTREINIMMAHGTLNMDIGKNAYNPLSSDSFDASGMDYIALGHFHNRFEAAGRQVTAYNPGSPEPLGFDEEGVHGIYAIEISTDGSGGKSIEARFVPLNQRTYRNITVNADGSATDERIAGICAEAVKAAGGSGDLYSLTLKGKVEQGFVMDKRLLESQLKGLAFYVRIKDETTPGYDFDEIAGEPGLRGLFARKLLEKAREAADRGDEKGRLLALQALYYGIEAMEQGEICI